MMTLARRPTAEGEEFEAHTGDVIYANAAGILHARALRATRKSASPPILRSTHPPLAKSGSTRRSGKRRLQRLEFENLSE